VTPSTGTAPRSPQDLATARNEYAPFVSLLVPGYALRLSPSAEGSEPDHGLFWSADWLVRAGQYRHGGSFSVVEFFRGTRRMGRLVYRLRFLGLPSRDPIVHLMSGVGAHFTGEGVGPRGELDLLVAEHFEAGFLLTVAYEYDTVLDVHVTELSAGAFIPYLFR
jgi:hypothetical protein